MSAARALSRRRRVLLTRSEEDCAGWAAELERRGLEPVVLPCIAAEPVDSPALRARLSEAAARADWIVFTSRRGVDAYARLLGGAPARPEGARIAVVGEATARAARAQLGRADLVGAGGTAEALAASLIRRVREAAATGPGGARAGTAARTPTIVVAVAANARPTLERELGAAGLDCRRFDVYRTVPAATPPGGKRPLAALGVDAVWLASPSAAAGFANQVALVAEAPAGVRIVTIGPSTSRAARELGLDVAAEADEPSLEGLLRALERAAG